MIRIAVDAMGGDRGPETIVEGALDAAREHGLSLTLVGREDRLRELMAGRPGVAALDVIIVPADDVIGMGEPPTSALRRRPSGTRGHRAGSPVRRRRAGRRGERRLPAAAPRAVCREGDRLRAAGAGRGAAAGWPALDWRGRDQGAV